jgi:hypothetical protein
VLNAIPATAGSVAASYLAGGAARSNWGAGGVLQVVNATFSTQTATTSTTFVDTGLTATITPSSSTSKILVFINGVYQTYVTSGNARDAGGSFQLVRASTNIWSPSTITNYLDGSTGATLSFNMVNTFNINYLDSPATTSATTYKLQYYAVSGRTFVINPSGTSAPSSITLMEISA